MKFRIKLPTNTQGEWEVCKHAKRQKAKKALDYVSFFPNISYVLQLLAAALQLNKASLFVSVARLILKGGDSRLKLLPFANFHFFTSYLRSAVILGNKTH